MLFDTTEILNNIRKNEIDTLDLHQERLAQAKGYQSTQMLTGHKDPIWALIILKDERIVSGSRDGDLRIWDSHAGQCSISPLKGHTGVITTIVELNDGRIVSSSMDNTLRVWDSITGKCLETLKGHTDVVSTIVELEGGRIVSGSWDGTLRIWDGNTYEHLAALKNHASKITALTKLRGNRIVSGFNDGTIEVWDNVTRQCLATLNKHTNEIKTFLILKNERLASSSGDGTLRIWDGTDYRPLTFLKGHTDYVTVALIELEDGRIVSGSGDNTLKVWDSISGTCLATLNGHTNYIRALSILENNRMVSGSRDETIRIWDTTTYKCLETLREHNKGISALAVLKDGRIISGSWDNTLRIWKGGIPVLAKAQFDEIVAALQSNHSIKTLSFTRSNITDNHIRALVALLKVNSHITSLDLSSNSITDAINDLLIDLLKINTSLQILKLQDKPIENINKLLESKKKISHYRKNNQKNEALFEACQMGLLGEAKLLLQQGAEPLAKSGSNRVNGYQPIHFAARNGHLELIKLLLENKVKIDEPNDAQNMPLHLACYYNSSTLETIEFLVDKTSDITLLNKWERTPLHEAVKTDAAQNKNEDYVIKVVEVLLTKDTENLLSKSITKDKQNCTTLDYAYKYEYYQVLLNLLEQYKKYNQLDDDQIINWCKKLTDKKPNLEKAWLLQAEILLVRNVFTNILSERDENIKNLTSQSSDQSRQVVDLTEKLKYFEAEKQAFIAAKHQLEAERDKLQNQLEAMKLTKDRLEAENQELYDLLLPEIPTNSITINDNKPLGKGSFGTVQLGLWEEAVAVKKLHPFYHNDEEIRRFKREAALLARLRSPYIVKLFGVDFNNGYRIIMEYLPKGSLRQFISEKAIHGFESAEIRKIGLQISYGLKHLHSQNILHLDLKPENILIGNDNKLKLADFGVSVKQEEATATLASKKGTYHYMSPEILEKGKAGFQKEADIYSYGIILWELSATKLPYKDEGLLQDDTTASINKFYQHVVVQEKRPTPSPDNIAVLKSPEGQALSRLIKQCWDKQPNKRPTAYQIVQQLEQPDALTPPPTQHQPETSGLPSVSVMPS